MCVWILVVFGQIEVLGWIDNEHKGLVEGYLFDKGFAWNSMPPIYQDFETVLPVGEQPQNRSREVIQYVQCNVIVIFILLSKVVCFVGNLKFLSDEYLYSCELCLTGMVDIQTCSKCLNILRCSCGRYISYNINV